MKSFWDELPKPFWVLAPMEDVTDTVFRQIVASVGKPHVMFTEFCNVDAICFSMSSRPKRRDPLTEKGFLDAARNDNQEPIIQRLVFTEGERPMVAQIWGTKPDKFCRASKKIREMGFDGIDINFGCPEKRVTKLGACGAMIFKDNIQSSKFNVQEIIAATKEGAGGLPVSVKTRIGVKKIMTEEWIGFLLEQRLAAITIHGRTVAELSSVPAHWEEIGKAVNCKRRCKCKTLIIGNGDVKSLDEGREKVEKYGVDGVMIGRGIFANPALFADKELSQREKIGKYRLHIQRFYDTWRGDKDFEILKKFMKVYINGFKGAAEARQKIARAVSLKDLTEAVEELSGQIGEASQ